MRFRLALSVAKLSRIISVWLGRGQGTSLPGLLALRIDPGFIQHFSRQLTGQVIYIVGTNGKTTTARLVAAIMHESQVNFIANPSSANLPSGIASSLAANSDLKGRLKAENAILEVDEQALVKLSTALPPTVLVMTNLFRDQLDRYGEIEAIVNKWRQALISLVGKATLIINGNDLRLVDLSNSYGGPKKFFGISKGSKVKRSTSSACDAARCAHCGGHLKGERFMAHLGYLECQRCGLCTPNLDAELIDYKLLRSGGLDASIKVHKKIYNLHSKLFGRFNAFNLTTAFLLGQTLEVADDKIIEALEKTQPVFGRSEHFSYQGTSYFIHLAKNPTGYNEVLLALATGQPKLNLLLALNDNWADGQDISWLWDVDFEKSTPLIESLIASGQRSGDLAVRLKIAGTDNIIVKNDLWQAFLATTKKGARRVDIIASYTAMIFLRGQLVKKGLVPKTWGDQK